MDLLEGKSKDIVFGEDQKAAVLNINILFTSGKMAMMSNFNIKISTIIETDCWDFALA